MASPPPCTHLTQSAQHLLAHAILGAAVSYATGNNITTGALSGASSEVAASALADYLYGTKDPELLTQDQKDTITSILNLATAATIYTATDGNAADTAGAAEVGKVGVENNNNIPLGSFPYYNLNDIAYFNQQIGMQEHCQANPNAAECQPRRDPMQPLKEAIPNIPKGAVSVGVNGHVANIFGGAAEVGIVATNNNSAGFPDLGLYYTYSEGVGSSSGLGINYSVYSEGRSNFEGSSNSLNTCLPIACSSVHTNEKGKIIGGSGSKGAKTPGVTFMTNKTNVIMGEDILNIADRMSNRMKDGGVKKGKK